jgi:transposase
MLKTDYFKNIFLYRPFIDFRKSINGICEIVQEKMAFDPFSNYLFVFCNKKRDKLKVLYWDKTGFALWYKRLEKEKFRWPKKLEEENIAVTAKNFELFLSGLNPWELHPHEELKYKKVA